MRYGEDHPRASAPDAAVDEARARHRAGESIAAIAQQMGRPYHTVYDWCAYRTRQGVRALREAE